MDKIVYMQEAERQLSNKKLYEHLTQDLMEQNQKELDEFLQDLPQETQEKITASISQECRPGNFYLTPKSCKLGNQGSHIVSGIGGSF